nr:MAG TPA: transmembrane protein [Caudoviricetes sp.]
MKYAKFLSIVVSHKSDFSFEQSIFLYCFLFICMPPK